MYKFLCGWLTNMKGISGAATYLVAVSSDDLLSLQLLTAEVPAITSAAQQVTVVTVMQYI